MRSIERRFETTVQKHPNHSTYICFAMTVKHQGFDRRSIRYWFDRLVDKEDYKRSDANSLVKQLHELSNMSEERTFSVEYATGRNENIEMEFGT